MPIEIDINSVRLTRFDASTEADLDDGRAFRMDAQGRILHDAPEVRASLDRLTAAVERLIGVLERRA
jgi:hypothetical protein